MISWSEIFPLVKIQYYNANGSSRAVVASVIGLNECIMGSVVLEKCNHV